MPAQTGEKAPSFTLNDQDGNKFSSEDLLGHKALIVFIPFPFSSICQAELCAIRDDYRGLEDLDARVVAITCNTRHVIKRWSEEQGFGFPVLSDFWPHGAVAREYGCFNEELGVAMRWTFVLDREGVVRAIVKTDSILEPRAVDAYREALAKI